MKKSMFVLLAAMLCCVMFAVGVSAATEIASGTCGDNLTWTLDDTGTLTISGSGDMYNWYLYKNVPWCSVNKSVTHVVIENGVTSIGNFAFDSCENLTDIIIPDSVTFIGEEAFGDCYSLTSITIPESVTSFGRHAFHRCLSLTSIIIPASVTDIGLGTFLGCKALTDAYFCGDVVNIWNKDDLGYNAFYSTSPNLTIYYPEGNTSGWTTPTWRTPDGMVYNTATFVPKQTEPTYIASGTCGDNLTWTLDENGTLTILGMGAMWNWDRPAAPWYADREKIVQVEIESGVTTIGDYAFYSCSNLNDITIPTSITYVGSNSFAFCSGIISITIPDSVDSIGKRAFYDCGGLETINLSQGITSIESYAFYGCNKLVSLIIPSGVTSIGNYAFYDCGGLLSLTIPNKVTYIGSHAFHNCYSLSGTLHIPDGVTYISDYAFYGCEGFTGSLVIPDSVTYIGDYSFAACVNMTGNLTISNNVATIGSYAFYRCGKLSGTLIIPDSVKTIRNNAFQYCGRFTGALNIPDSVTSIGSYAFADCSRLNAIIIPDSISSIGSYSFSHCGAVTSITIPDSVYSISNYAFYACSGLTSLVIPNSITSIGAYAFSHCTGLTSVTIPSSVASIGDDAFVRCGNLKEINFCGDVPEEWGSMLFSGVSEDFTIYYPAGNTSGWTSPTWTAPDGTVYNTKTFNPEDLITGISTTWDTSVHAYSVGEYISLSGSVKTTVETGLRDLQINISNADTGVGIKYCRKENLGMKEFNLSLIPSIVAGATLTGEDGLGYTHNLELVPGTVWDIQLWATDNAGNTLGESVIKQIRIEEAPSGIPIMVYMDTSDITLTEGDTFTFEGTVISSQSKIAVTHVAITDAENAANGIDYYRNDEHLGRVWNISEVSSFKAGDTLTGLCVTNSQQEMTLSPGTYIIRMWVMDEAGNRSSAVEKKLHILERTETPSIVLNPLGAVTLHTAEVSAEYSGGYTPYDYGFNVYFENGTRHLRYSSKYGETAAYRKVEFKNNTISAVLQDLAGNYALKLQAYANYADAAGISQTVYSEMVSFETRITDIYLDTPTTGAYVACNGSPLLVTGHYNKEAITDVVVLGPKITVAAYDANGHCLDSVETQVASDASMRFSAYLDIPDATEGKVTVYASGSVNNIPLETSCVINVYSKAESAQIIRYKGNYQISGGKVSIQEHDKIVVDILSIPGNASFMKTEWTSSNTEAVNIIRWYDNVDAGQESPTRVQLNCEKLGEGQTSASSVITFTGVDYDGNTVTAILLVEVVPYVGSYPLVNELEVERIKLHDIVINGKGYGYAHFILKNPELYTSLEYQYEGYSQIYKADVSADGSFSVETPHLTQTSSLQLVITAYGINGIEYTNSTYIIYAKVNEISFKQKLVLSGNVGVGGGVALGGKFNFSILKAKASLGSATLTAGTGNELSFTIDVQDNETFYTTEGLYDQSLAGQIDAGVNVELAKKKLIKIDLLNGEGKIKASSQFGTNYIVDEPLSPKEYSGINAYFTIQLFSSPFLNLPGDIWKPFKQLLNRFCPATNTISAYSLYMDAALSSGDIKFNDDSVFTIFNNGLNFVYTTNFTRPVEEGQVYEISNDICIEKKTEWGNFSIPIPTSKSDVKYKVPIGGKNDTETDHISISAEVRGTDQKLNSISFSTVLGESQGWFAAQKTTEEINTVTYGTKAANAFADRMENIGKLRSGDSFIYPFYTLRSDISDMYFSEFKGYVVSSVNNKLVVNVPLEVEVAMKLDVKGEIETEILQEYSYDKVTGDTFNESFYMLSYSTLQDEDVENVLFSPVKWVNDAFTSSCEDIKNAMTQMSGFISNGVSHLGAALTGSSNDYGVVQTYKLADEEEGISSANMTVYRSASRYLNARSASLPPCSAFIGETYFVTLYTDSTGRYQSEYNARSSDTMVSIAYTPEMLANAGATEQHNIYMYYMVPGEENCTVITGSVQNRDTMTVAAPWIGNGIYILGVDNTPPEIKDVVYDETALYISIEEQSGVNSISVILDGQLIADSFRVTSDMLSAGVIKYPLVEPLASGKHAVQISATDKLNNTSSYFEKNIQIGSSANVYTITGNIKSFGDGDISITLLKDGVPVDGIVKDITGDTYTITNVPAGTYTLRVSKPKHVTREYTIVVGTP